MGMWNPALQLSTVIQNVTYEYQSSYQRDTSSQGRAHVSILKLQHNNKYPQRTLLTRSNETASVIIWSYISCFHTTGSAFAHIYLEYTLNTYHLHYQATVNE